MSEAPWIIRIALDGTVQTLWHDALPLDKLGTPQVRRLTDVEHDGSGWTLTWHHSRLPMTPDRFVKRGDALAEERRLIMLHLQTLFWPELQGDI